ncbi:MAG TPA: FAD-binding protein [Myxococcota bacterium]|nr:FAD-binding protein [Myxococcota bacterium]
MSGGGDRVVPGPPLSRAAGAEGGAVSGGGERVVPGPPLSRAAGAATPVPLPPAPPGASAAPSLPTASYDVVVIGGGAAGAVAALAATEAGARVVVVRKAYGATALSSGCIDLGGDPRRLPGDGFAPERRATLAGRLDLLRRLKPEHPLAVTGADAAALAEAVEFLRGHVPFVAPAPVGSEPARLVATAAGTWRETGSGALGIVRGELLAAAAAPSSGGLAVVGLAGAPWTDAAPPARGLAAALAAEGVDVEVRPLDVDFLRRPARAPDEVFSVAAALDAPGEGARLGAAIARALDAAGGARPALVLLPPLVGLDRAAAVLAEVEAAAGVRCAEMAAAPPSVPGLRLQRALDAALARAGVNVVAGDARGEPGPSAARRRVERVVVWRAGAAVEAFAGREVVLATGKFLAGGVVKDPGGPFREPVLGLRVADAQGGDPAAEPERFTARTALAEHPVFSYGVRVDAALRPLDAGGAVAVDNVRCAGAILAGYAAATDGAALGTALFTGLRAGRLAAAAVAAGVPAGAAREMADRRAEAAALAAGGQHR